MKRLFEIAIVSAIIIVTSPFILAALEPNQQIFEEIKGLSPEQALERLKYIQKAYADNAKTASHAQILIGLELEKMGKETEATAEYLKIMMNYPQEAEAVNKAEERLRELYKKLASPEPTAERQKESRAIFISYVKSLYETYRDQAQYDKAITVLKRLISLENDNDEYYIELGAIYLDGLNNPTTAIKYFNQAMTLNPHQPNLYNYLGYGYEKLGDYEKAKYYYKECVSISPTLAASQHARNRLQAIELMERKQLVKDWYLLGPFENNLSGKEDILDIKSKEIEFDKEYAGKNGGIVKWFRPYNISAYGYMDLKSIFPANDFAVAYALTFVYAPDEMNVQIRTGHEGTITIWLNKKEAARKNINRIAECDRNISDVKLQKGWNEIIIKSAVDWGRWGFFFRVTDLQGNPTGKLVFDPARNYDRVKAIYKELALKEALSFTRNLLVYGTTIFFFLVGLGFMVFNIRNRIRINIVKANFVSNVSHQLKTPLTSIKMFAETLRLGNVDSKERTQQYYDLIMREADRLTRFVDNVLNFSKIEKNQKVYNLEPTDIGKLVRDTVEVFKKEFIARDAATDLKIEKDLPPVEADGLTMIEAVANLLDNAVKYSKEDKTITVDVTKGPDDIAISVTDRGVGMPNDELTRIFEAFHRVENKDLPGVKGTGLGLSFVKHIVEAHGGRVDVKSQLGSGSTFTIKLPIKKMQQNRKG